MRAEGVGAGLSPSCQDNCSMVWAQAKLTQAMLALSFPMPWTPVSSSSTCSVPQTHWVMNTSSLTETHRPSSYAVPCGWDTLWFTLVFHRRCNKKLPPPFADAKQGWELEMESDSESTSTKSWTLGLPVSTQSVFRVFLTPHNLCPEYLLKASFPLVEASFTSYRPAPSKGSLTHWPHTGASEWMD